MATIEISRLENQRNSKRSFVHTKQFEIVLKDLLDYYTPQDLIEILQQMKYYPVEEPFLYGNIQWIQKYR